MFHMIPVAALGMMVQGAETPAARVDHILQCSAVVHRAQEVKRRRPVDDPLRRRLEINLRVNAALAPTVDAAVAADKTTRAGLDGRTAAAMASVTAMTDQALAEGLVACAKYVGVSTAPEPFPSTPEARTFIAGNEPTYALAFDRAQLHALAMPRGEYGYTTFARGVRVSVYRAPAQSNLGLVSSSSEALEFNCGARRLRRLGLVARDAAGAVLAAEADMGEWSSPKDGTVAFTALEVACNTIAHENRRVDALDKFLERWRAL